MATTTNTTSHTNNTHTYPHQANGLCRCGTVGQTYMVTNNGHVHFDVCAVCAQECVQTHS